MRATLRVNPGGWGDQNERGGARSEVVTGDERTETKDTEAKEAKLSRS